MDYHHPFTFDLDVFGQNSLFARLNRTVTTGGKALLARNLSFEEIQFQPKEIHYMSHQVSFMDNLQALGEGRTIDTLAMLALQN